MNIEELTNKITEAKIKNPIWFGLDADKIPALTDIISSEQSLNTKLPKDYLDFLKKFGGGLLAFTVIYSLDNDSDFNLLKINKQYNRIRDKFLLISENGAGDFIGVNPETYEAKPNIYFFDHETGIWSKTKYCGILDYIYQTALRIT